MWWNNYFEDKKKKDDRLRIQMELALAQPNPYLEKLELMKQEQKHRDMERDLHRAQLSAMSSIVPQLDKAGLISFEEYKKWLLDETGTYIPKLKTKK